MSEDRRKWRKSSKRREDYQPSLLRHYSTVPHPSLNKPVRACMVHLLLPIQGSAEESRLPSLRALAGSATSRMPSPVPRRAGNKWGCTAVHRHGRDGTVASLSHGKTIAPTARDTPLPSRHSLRYSRNAAGPPEGDPDLEVHRDRASDSHEGAISCSRQSRRHLSWECLAVSLRER